MVAINKGQAMVLAAGKGKRMGSLSDHTPKPLTRVLDISLLDRILDKLFQADVRPVVLNIHHLADQLEAHIACHKGQGDIIISDERDALLETGGGVRKALPLLEKEFLVINSDILWHDATQGKTAIEQLQHVWDPAKMDVLLLLISVDHAYGYGGVGDFFYDAQGDALYEANKIHFRGDADHSPYMFGGIQIVKASMYDDMPDGAWSNREIFRKAAANGRLYGAPYEGLWMHVGTEDAIKDAEDRLLSLGQT
jgi:MurNAc alpha-1-phosphate uridylyltransferase